MTARSVCLLAVFSLAPAASAFAKPPAPVDKPPIAKHFDFDDDQVEVGLSGPEAEVLEALHRGPQLSLIRIRENFTPELLQSADGV
jgi:hypothetical protein